MNRIYLDNAATTCLAPEVFEAMVPYLRDHYGNPSSTHAHGRQSKAGIVTSRKKIGELLNCSPNEIIFTSGGTEADNMAISCAIRDLGVARIITSKIEHKAVLQTAQFWENVLPAVTVEYVDLESNGCINYTHLESLLNSGKDKKTLVSLMHGNNEVGALLDLKRVSQMCRLVGAYFHSDTVQTMAHYALDLSELDLDFATCSAHKFHGPKGNGFLYVNKNLNINPMIIGGGQERNLRAGTENVPGIVGLAKALEVAFEDLDTHKSHISGLKQLMKRELELAIPDVQFNGDCTEEGLYTVLSVSFPPSEVSSMFLFSLDIQGISASGGSACSSGSDKGSHVLDALNSGKGRLNVRFSFGRYNTEEEVRRAVAIVKQILEPQSVS